MFASSRRPPRTAAGRAAATPGRRRRGGTLATVSTDPKDRWLDLGSFIREQRGSARLSLRRLSELAGISNPYLSQIERGLRRPSAEILQQIAKALRISAETLYVQAGILEAPVGAPDLSPPSWPTRPSARSRSRRWCASTSRSAAITRTSGPGRRLRARIPPRARPRRSGRERAGGGRRGHAGPGDRRRIVPPPGQRRHRLSRPVDHRSPRRRVPAPSVGPGGRRRFARAPVGSGPACADSRFSPCTLRPWPSPARATAAA